jgi:hypothetical protein
MRVSAALVIATLLAAGGCSSPAYYWYDPDRSLEEAKADYMDCLDQARHESGNVINDQHYDRVAPPNGSSVLPGLPPDQNRKVGDPAETQKAWRQRYEQSIIADGMRDKGYLQVSANRIPRRMPTQKVPAGGGVAGR